MEWIRARHDRFRSWLYNALIVSFTSKWYREVLDRLPRQSCLLDVGIGTGTALLRNADLIKDKKIVVRGVDYDWSYILTCREEVQAMDLQNAIHVVHESIYDYRPAPSDDVQSFDAVYFSGSFMILPDKALALKRVIALLKDQQLGSIFFTQTFEQKKNPFLEWLKPRLSYWTSIDFGSVTYEDDFDTVLDACGVDIVRKETINDGKEKLGVRRSVIVEARARRRGM